MARHDEMDDVRVENEQRSHRVGTQAAKGITGGLRGFELVSVAKISPVKPDSLRSFDLYIASRVFVMIFSRNLKLYANNNDISTIAKLRE